MERTRSKGLDVLGQCDTVPFAACPPTLALPTSRNAAPLRIAGTRQTFRERPSGHKTPPTAVPDADTRDVEAGRPNADGAFAGDNGPAWLRGSKRGKSRCDFPHRDETGQREVTLRGRVCSRTW